MRGFAILALTTIAVIALGGCMGGGTDDGPAPRTHEFDLYVEQSTSSVIGLYPRNDNSTQGAVAITFKANPDDPQAVPGPEIRVMEGDTVIIHLQNQNGLAHTIHLHGGLVPWEEDGVDYLTQMPVRQGEEFTYTFRDLKAGTYWYHCHVDGAHHIDFGMYGAFIVEERDPPVDYDRDYVVFLDEFDSCHVHGNTDPVATPTGDPQQPVEPGQEPSADYQAQSECYYRFLQDNLAQNQAITTTGQAVNNTVPQGAKDTYCPAMVTAMQGVPEPARSNALVAAGCQPPHSHGTPPVQQTPRSWWFETHPLYNPLYNTFVINGKAFPDSPVFPVREGETVRFRIINAGNEVHTWHPHGHTMEVITKDGYELAGGPQKMDTLSIAPGERYDYVMEMDNPGLWMIHDQMGQYTVNDDVHPGGMMACFAYDGFEGVDAFAMTRAIDCNHEAVRILAERGPGHEHGG
jgi:FtsP/CotA-like multicopper oxidase with cupredoxin domain